jgi:pSer/pThr/pTyr-binding forkhead associated (FHA) protein
LADGPAGSRPQTTTVLHVSRGNVRVSWHDRRGDHEKVFDGGFRIGRDEGCEIHLDDPMISRRHAEVSHDDGHWWIADLGSRNGTLVDGERITRVPLPVYCEVRLYETAPVLRIEVLGGSNAATITSSRLHPGGT